MSDDDIQMTLTVNFCFTAARTEVEGRTPFEVAALLQPRLDPNGFFVFGGKIELAAADGTEVRVAIFKSTDYDHLTGIFIGDVTVAEDYLRSVPPSDRADWEESENAGADEASGGADPEG